MIQLQIIFKFWKIQDPGTTREQKDEGASKSKFFFKVMVANKVTAELSSKTFSARKTKMPLPYMWGW